MANSKCYKSKAPIPLFAATTFDIFDSLLYKKKLNNAARIAYLLLCRQKGADYWKREVICPYTTAKDYINKRAWKRSIDLLSENGFIEITQKGGLFRKTNVYTFSYKWKEKERQLQMVISNRGRYVAPVRKAKRLSDGCNAVPVKFQILNNKTRISPQ